MIRAIVWKEFREQGVISLTLIVLGGGLLVAAGTIGEPPSPGVSPIDVIRSLGVGRVATLLLAVTAGMVCGGALFAAEREAGTIAFLELLPAALRKVWRAKLVAGVALAVFQVSALLAIAAIVGLVDFGFAFRIALYTLLAFSWGTLGSTLARTTLGSVGIAIPAATLASFVYLLPIYLFLGQPGSNFPQPIGWLIFVILMLVTPLAVSEWRFTAPDHTRCAERSNGLGGVRALLWLTLRQLRIIGSVLSAFAFVFGLAFLLPGIRPVFVFPMLSLATGVLAGVAAFGDEQSRDTARFWADLRLPLGRLWCVKIGLYLLLVLWLLMLVALPGIIRAQFESNMYFGDERATFAAFFHSRFFDEIGSQAWKYLLVPAAYGFAVGHLCGLLFRKLVVACGVAMMVGGSLAALWMPSLLAGGVRHWQVWLPAALVLITGRLLLRSWAGDRLMFSGSLWRLAGGATTALGLLAIGLSYRVLEVPNNVRSEDDVAFVESLPTFDENLAGRDFRSAAERYARLVATLPREPVRPTDIHRPLRIDERLETTFRLGWPKDDPDLAAWLDRMFVDEQPASDEKPWHALAAEASTKPIGIYEHPLLVSTAALTSVSLENAWRMATAILVRGLQQQAAGDPAAFVVSFRTAMSLAHNLRTGSGVHALVIGIDVERAALLSADRWLERLTGNAALLREMARVIEQRDSPHELDLQPHFLADRYVLRQMMRSPEQWLPNNLTASGTTLEQATEEADLVGFAWTVPWERERTRRLLGLGFELGSMGPRGWDNEYLIGRPGAWLLFTRNRTFGDLVERDRFLRANRRAAVLKFALRAFQADRKSVPSLLAELVSGGYLAAIPEDPYSRGQPFSYRVSAGESLTGSHRAKTQGRALDHSIPVRILPGQMVLWCVGKSSGVDIRSWNGPGEARSEDLVFLVPMPVSEPK